MADIVLTPDRAEAVIVEAMQDKLGEGPVYPGSMPESADRRVEIATDLVGHAITAWTADNMRGVEVADILKAAGVTIADDGTASQNGAGHVPEPREEARSEDPPAEPEPVTLVGPDGSEVTVPEASASALEAAGFTRKEAEQPEEEQVPDEPEEDPEAYSDDDEVTVDIAGTLATMKYGTAKALIASGAATLSVPASDGDPQGDPPEDGDPSYEVPWDGYNDLKDAQIRSAMEDMSDEEIAYVKGYEATRGSRARKRILNFEKGKARKRKEDEEAPKGEEEAAEQAEQAADRDSGPVDERVQGIDPVLEQEGELPPADADEGHIGETRVGSVTAEEERIIAVAEVEKSRLPIPNEEISDPPQFPEDLGDVSDEQLFKLHSQFNACLALANWKLGLLTIDERAFKHIAEKRKYGHVRGADRNDPTTGRAKAQDRIEAEAEMQQDVQDMRDRQHLAAQRAIPMRKLVEIYAGHVEVLSRQWTFRERELGSSGKLAPRARSAGD